MRSSWAHAQQLDLNKKKRFSRALPLCFYWNVYFAYSIVIGARCALEDEKCDAALLSRRSTLRRPLLGPYASALRRSNSELQELFCLYLEAAFFCRCDVEIIWAWAREHDACCIIKNQKHRSRSGGSRNSRIDYRLDPIPKQLECVSLEAARSGTPRARAAQREGRSRRALPRVLPAVYRGLERRRHGAS